MINKTMRISTRGRFDLLTGKPIKNKSTYTLYPAHSFEKIRNSSEIAIMIHGLRNDPSSALEKFNIAKKRLRKLGYAHPVVGFTYDSNTRGAHLQKTQLRALRAGQRIAKHNGKNLAQFLIDFHSKNKKIKFRLLGHSLGTEVIQSTITYLDNKKIYNLVSAVYLFGSSLASNCMQKNQSGDAMQRTVGKVVNYYNPKDEVLSEALDGKVIDAPLGLVGSSRKPVKTYIQRRVYSKNHRFASYALTLKKFP